MIDALISGRMFGVATERMDRNNKPYCTGKVRVPTANGETLFVNIICFEARAITALLALGDGDSVALTGECTPKVFAAQGEHAKPCLDLRVHAVLTAYHVTRRRQAMEGA